MRQLSSGACLATTFKNHLEIESFELLLHVSTGPLIAKKVVLD